MSRPETKEPNWKRIAGKMYSWAVCAETLVRTDKREGKILGTLAEIKGQYEYGAILSLEARKARMKLKRKSKENLK